MNGTAHIKSWIRSIHIHTHESVLLAKKLLFNKQLWTEIGIGALVLGFVLLIMWAAEAGRQTIFEGIEPPSPFSSRTVMKQSPNAPP